ncbi:MAG: SUMF1/EgtB/PvdO family nonheme iron enzyme [Candidatus Marinimicrobia bacterium]|nr:SUMF1/EgtB/PvdO family nonheme iron enzyme [Candidatus Neomarinimicrobiota bacterium]
MKNIIITLISALVLLSGCGISEVENYNAPIPVVETGINSDAWVTIPAGEFYKGQHNHETLINYDYEIMVTEVTNKQYAAFLNAGLSDGTLNLKEDGVYGHHAGDPFHAFKHEFEIPAGQKLLFPVGINGPRILLENGEFVVVGGYNNHPVVMVSWFGADAYAKYYGWRLPTENEWEKAGRGKDTRSYPWGDEFDHGYANYYSSYDGFEKIYGKGGGTTPVGYYNGKTYDGFETHESKNPYGLYDIAGNVWEWSGDDYINMHYRFLRGGSISTYENDLRVWSANNSAGPQHFALDAGFRCARSENYVNPGPVYKRPGVTAEHH